MPKKRKVVTTTVVTEIVEDKNDVLIEFVLDRSGSMGHLTSSTISGFNEYLTAQKALKDDAEVRFTLTQFAERAETTVNNVLLQNVPELSHENYQATGGSTSLWDAMGGALNRVLNMKDRPSRVLVVVMTDGQENSSREYSASRVRELSEKAKSEGVELVFLGANMDSFAVGGSVGVSSGSTQNWVASAAGMTKAFSTLTSNTVAYRNASVADYAVGSFYNQDTSAVNLVDPDNNPTA